MRSFFRTIEDCSHDLEKGKFSRPEIKTDRYHSEIVFEIAIEHVNESPVPANFAAYFQSGREQGKSVLIEILKEDVTTACVEVIRFKHIARHDPFP